MNQFKKRPQSRVIISVFLFLYFSLLLVFSALGDSFNQWSPWSPKLASEPAYFVSTESTTTLSFVDTYENASIRFSMSFIVVTLLSMLGYFFAKELNSLIFKNQKLTFYVLLVSFVLGFFLISMSYIVPIYFFNSYVSFNDVNTNKYSLFLGNDRNVQIKPFSFGFLHIYDGKTLGLFNLLVSSTLVLVFLVVIDIVMLRIYRILNKKSCISLLLIHLITMFGLLTGSYILIIRGWTTLLLICFIAVFTDIYSYFFGKKFGRHQLIANISPNKTWAGAVCGILFSTFTITSILLIYAIPSFNATITNISSPTAYDLAPQKYDQHNLITNLFIISFIISGSTFKVYWWIATIMIVVFLSIISIIGDLTFSYVKRCHSIKDYGNFLGKHGGFLDRFDSMAMILCVYMIYLLLVFIISGRSMLEPNSYVSNIGFNFSNI